MIPEPIETPAESNTGMPLPTGPGSQPVHEHEIIAPLAAEGGADAQPAYGVIARYVGAGYHSLPGLPGRDLTAMDIAGSGWTLEDVLKIVPPVYVAVGEVQDEHHG
jgi:hypothetical protein